MNKDNIFILVMRIIIWNYVYCNCSSIDMGNCTSE